MHLIRRFLTALLALLTLTLSLPDATAARRSKPKTSASAKKSSRSQTPKKSKSKSSSKSSSKSKSKSKSRGKHSSRGRSYVRSYAPSEEQLEQMRQDSLRLRTGGDRPMQQVSDLGVQASELLTTRFRRADTTLTTSELHELYFAVSDRKDTGSFLEHIEREADSLIDRSRFADALKVVQQGLWRTPTYLPLIKRACDLSLHLKDAKFNTYMYQLVELMSMISHTGTGESWDKAIQVRSASDALLVEQHWHETAREAIISSREQQHAGKTYQVLRIKDSVGAKERERYYLLRPTNNSSDK